MQYKLSVFLQMYVFSQVNIVWLW